MIKAMSSFNIEQIRANFPILNQQVNGKPLVYLDNGASTQKPTQVINAISNYYLTTHANVHRGVHYLSQQATNQFEAARKTIQNHLNAKHQHEIIFTKGTTEAINLVAFSLSEMLLKPGDEIVVSEMEHHANIVPWQQACFKKKAALKVIPVLDNGELNMDVAYNLITKKTKIVALSHISNTLGTINPIEEIISHAHKVGAKVLIDGAQAMPHQKVDVRAINCDFYCFSGHKLFGPTGTGVLYGKEELLNSMEPYQTGGEMIQKVSFEKTTFNELPFKFEAGTPHIAGFIGLAEAINYVNQIGLELIAQHESALLHYATNKLQQNFNTIKLVGTASKKASVISFLMANQHPYDTGTILDQLGIAVRTGNHCTEPLMNRFQIPGTVRASFSFYNTFQEVDALIEGLKKAQKLLE